MSRPIERIPIFLNLVKPRLDEYLTKVVGIEDEVIRNIWKEFIEDSWERIEKIWNSKSDLRFAQVLLEFSLYKKGFWYYREENDALETLGVNLKEYALWGTFGKDGLEDRHFIKVIDMSTSHIQNVLQNVQNIKEEYRVLFKEILNERLSDKGKSN